MTKVGTIYGVDLMVNTEDSELIKLINEYFEELTKVPIFKVESLKI